MFCLAKLAMLCYYVWCVYSVVFVKSKIGPLF